MIAVLTGSTSGIGLELLKVLLELDYKVFALGRDFKDPIFIREDQNITKVVCDLKKSHIVEKEIKEISKNYPVDLLINCAGIGHFGPFEEVSSSKIIEMVRVNLEAPLIITQLLMRNLKKNKGRIVNISSVTSTKSSPFGVSYSATKAGLAHFSNGLFDEVRKFGVEVTTIRPDITKTPFYEGSFFKEGEDKGSYLTTRCIGDALRYVLSQRQGSVVTDITIKPKFHQIGKNTSKGGKS